MATTITLLLAEGAYSLIRGRSLVARLTNRVGGLELPQLEMLDDERLRAAALTAGPYASAVDPLVGFRVKGNAARAFARAPATTDANCERVRVGPPPEKGARRIVVLGDSVAFGFGLKDDETFAHCLEEALAGTMAEGSPRPVVRTIACPGWNVRNSTRYLRNHLARLDPDAVIFVPVGNDLHDSYVISEVGHRIGDRDPAFGATRPHVTLETNLLLQQRCTRRLPAPLALEILEAGGMTAVPHVVTSGVTPESRRRWQECFDHLGDLRARLAARGAHLAAMLHSEDPVIECFEAMAAERLPEMPVFGAFKERRAGDSLGHNPHPGPEYARACGLRMARFLIEREWVPGAGARPLPELSENFADRVWPTRTPAELRAGLEAKKKARARMIRSEIDLATGAGFHQVYGGLWPDDRVGRSLFFALRNPGGRRLSVSLERLPADCGIYPFHLGLEIGGCAVAAAVPVPRPEPGQSLETTLHFDLEVDLSAEPFLDLTLVPDNWIIEKVQGVSRVASFRFLSARLAGS